MTDYYLGVAPQSIEWELRGNVSRFQSPIGGVTRTLERVGARWAATWRWDAVAGEEAARIKSFLATQRGGGNRFWAYDPGYTMRGSYSAAELLTNPEFASGTTGWSFSTNTPGTVADALLTMRRAAHANTTDCAFPTAAATTVQYAPYAARSIDCPGVGPWNHGPQLGTAQGGEEYGRANSTAYGLKTFAATVIGTSTWFGLVDYDTGLNKAGDVIHVPFTTLARCALVDNGPNALIRSDEINDAAWTKNSCTVNTNSATSPEGTVTGEAIVEGPAGDGNVGHYVSQNVTVSSAAAEYCLTVYLSPVERTRVTLLMRETTGSTDAQANFDVSNGVVASGPSVGANWTNGRAFIRSAGGGWYRCTIVARKTNAATAIQFQIRMTDASGATTYVGDGASRINVWRAVAAQSSQPTRGMQTTTTADTDGVAQTGAGLFLKGLPVSTDSLVLRGDWIEIITPTYSELKRVTAPLNSDAAGLGYLQFEPTLRQSPADNAAVIIRKPLGRFMLDESTVKWSEGWVGVHSLSFTAVEDVAV